MKTLKSVLLIMSVLLLMPVTVVASEQPGPDSHGHNKVESGVDSHHDGHDMQSHQSGMSNDGLMMIVGTRSSKGVKGMAHIKDVSLAMSQHGMKTTHHFMIAFVDEETGKQIEKGTVALKVTNPDAKVWEPIELLGMDGHFGADITLDMKGEYHMKVGTQLEDGKKRKFHFHHVHK